MIRIIILILFLNIAIFAKHNSISTNYIQTELRLMLKSFLFINDVKDAYKTAKLGYKLNPSSYFWNKQMAKLALWNSKTTQALKYLIFLYKYTDDKTIRDKIINYAINDYQYDLAKKYVLQQALQNPINKNINTLIYIYNLIGVPQKAAVILLSQYHKNPKRAMLLTKALQIYLNMGELKKAKRIISIMIQKRLYSIKNTKQIAFYFYLMRKPATAYKYILLAKSKATKKDISYYKLISDLGWYEQDYITAAKASKIIMQNGKARLSDYVRVARIYQRTNPKLATLALLDAYKKYKLSWLFYSYAYHAMHLKDYKQIKKLILQIDKTNSSLKKDANFWLIKADVYIYFHQIKLAKLALNTARRLNKNNLEVNLMIISFYTTNHLNNELIGFLKELSEEKSLSPRYYLPMASAYFYLQNVNRAVFYMQKVMKPHAIDFKFLQAYIYQSQNNISAFNKLMRSIVKELDTKNPNIKKTDKFYNNYLSAAMYTQPASQFLANLKTAKKYLTKEHYRLIAYSYAIKNHAYEQSHEIINKDKNPPLWMLFSDAILFDNHTQIQNLLHLDLTSLPILDASSASHKDGQFSLSQSLAFKALDKNSHSASAYTWHLDLSRNEAGKFYAKASYYDRDPLIQKYIKLKNKTYIAKGWYLLSSFSYFKNSLTNENTFYNIPSNTLQMAVGMKKIYNRGYTRFYVGYKNSVRGYNYYSIDTSYKINPRLTVNIGYAKNKTANETIALLLTGKKDSVNLGFTFNILNSTAINFLYQKNYYTSSDNAYLGKGRYLRIDLTRQLRVGYPNMSIDAFYDNGVYKQANRYGGDAQRIVHAKNDILLNNFYDIGMIFNYGLINYTSYTRAWRPYFSVGTYYNAQANNLNYTASAGYGGMAFHQDHLVIGVSYQQSLNGVTGNIFKIFLKYHFLHAKP